MSAVEETVAGWDVVGPVGDGTPPSFAEPLAEAGWTVDAIVEERFGFVEDQVPPEPLAGPPADPPPPPPPPPPVEDEIEIPRDSGGTEVDAEIEQQAARADPEPTIEVGNIIEVDVAAPPVEVLTRPIAAPRRTRRAASVGRRIAAAIELVVIIVLAAVALATAIAVTVAALAFALRRAVGP